MKIMNMTIIIQHNDNQLKDYDNHYQGGKDDHQYDNEHDDDAGDRHDICQKIYATSFWGARILRRKRVNRDISQFLRKARKCFKIAKIALLCVRIKQT